MNKPFPHYSLIIAGLACIGGILICAFMNEWIIIKFPSYKTDCATYKKTTDVARNHVTLAVWNHNTWHHEKLEIIWSEDMAQNTYYTINSWLNLLDEEQITAKKTSLQTAMLNPSGQELFLSFDRNPFTQKSSTFEKWMWVEGLLKTLRENKITVQSVRFLVHHQPLDDDHLDFSTSWPLAGFIPA